MAAWDLCARRAGLPLHVLVGPGREPVPVYASALTAEALPQLVPPRLAAGWRGFKLKVGFGARVDADALAALREMAGPEAALVVDANLGPGAWMKRSPQAGDSPITDPSFSRSRSRPTRRLGAGAAWPASNRSHSPPGKTFAAPQLSRLQLAG